MSSGVTWKVSLRRTCAVLRAERSSDHSEGRRRSQAALTQRIKEIAETRVRYGYRRAHVSLRREGREINQKRAAIERANRSAADDPP